MHTIPKAPNNEEEKDIEVDFKPKLKLITGGKEPPSTTECWLQREAVGACFLAKEQGNPLNFALGLFRVGAKTDKAVVLNTPQHQGNLYVDPIAFCNKFRKFEDLGLIVDPQEEQKEEEEANERSGVQELSGEPDAKVE